MLTQKIELAPSQLITLLAVLLPEPSRASIESEMTMDRNKNPHGENHKPKQRGRNEVLADLRVAEARAIYDAAMRMTV